MQLNNAEVSLYDTDSIEFKYNPLKQTGTITIIDKFYSKISVDINGEQAEKLYNALDEQLHDETAKQMESRLLSDVVKAEAERDQYRELYLDTLEKLNETKGVIV
jgi:hypothetical protein